MKIKNIISFDMDQNCYLLYNEESMEGFLIDPGIDTEKIIRGIKEEGVRVTHILLTHCHYDHSFSVNALRDGRKLVCGKNCAENIKNIGVSLSYYVGDEFVIDTPDIILSDNEEIEIAGIKVKMIETPGHTSCSVCYLAGSVLFSGDTLFRNNVGRWDLPTGDEETLKKSIKEKLYTLPSSTPVMCGHGHDTVIGHEMDYNFFINK